MSDSIFAMAHWVDLFFILDIIVLFALLFIRKNVYRTMERSILSAVLLFILSAGYILYIPFKVNVLGYADARYWNYTLRYNPTITITNFSPLGFHLLDTYNYIKDARPLVLQDSDKKQITQWFNAKKENLPDNKYHAMFKGKNLLVIQVESLEEFVIGKKIENQEITPNLNHLLKNSLYFPEFHEQVNEGTSSDADLMTNTSVYPLRRGSTFFRYPQAKYNSMPKLFEKMGYSTLALHPDKGSFWNWMPALKSIGFQKCIDASYFRMDETIGLGLSDGSYLKQVEPIIKAQKQPFYTFMVTLTSHTPFNLPKEYRKLTLDDKLDQSHLGGYFQSIHYTDEQLGIFLKQLDTDGILKNTVVVLYGDHTGIHKYYQEEVSKMQPSEDWWVDNHHHIPLFIYEKDLQPEIIQTKGGEIDTMPTVSYLMGISEKEYETTAFGRNLLNTNKDFAVLSNKEYIGKEQDGKHKESAIEGLDIADKLIRSNYFTQPIVTQYGIK